MPAAPWCGCRSQASRSAPRTRPHWPAPRAAVRPAGPAPTTATSVEIRVHADPFQFRLAMFLSRRLGRWRAAANSKGQSYCHVELARRLRRPHSHRIWRGLRVAGAAWRRLSRTGRRCLRWLGVALVVDAIDGPLARRYSVATQLPRWSGDTLDLVVDFLTYVFVPAFAIARSGLLPDTCAVTGGHRHRDFQRALFRRPRHENRRTIISADFRGCGMPWRFISSCSAPPPWHRLSAVIAFWWWRHFCRFLSFIRCGSKRAGAEYRHPDRCGGLLALCRDRDATWRPGVWSPRRFALIAIYVVTCGRVRAEAIGARSS